jgi:hypothetical protein
VNELVLPAVNRPFVEALAEIAPVEGEWAVVGGFAVWAHLGETHRPTLDVDAAAAPTASETLITLGVPGDQPHRREIAGVKLEIISVENPSRYPEGLEGLSDQQRLFIVGHWSAATLSVERTVRCGELVVAVPVARALPLIACKLHAWLDRRDARAGKRGSDGLDVVRLLEAVDLSALAMEAANSPSLGQVVAWAAQTVLIDQAVRVDRMIAVHTDSAKPGADRVEMLGMLLHGLLSG